VSGGFAGRAVPHPLDAVVAGLRQVYVRTNPPNRRPEGVIMRRSPVIRRIVSAIAVGGLLAVGQVSGVGLTAASASHDHDGYHDRHDGRHYSSIETTTDLTVYSRFACARVWSHRGTPSGTVTFYLVGDGSATTYLSDGRACVYLSRDLRDGSYRLVARYNGRFPFEPSWDSEYFRVHDHDFRDDHHFRDDDHFRHDDHDFRDGRHQYWDDNDNDWERQYRY